MFPEKIKDFVISLIRKTEAGDFSWVYDDDSSYVNLRTNEFAVTLKYEFNADEEYGEFVFFYLDIAVNKQYRFYTNQTWSDYEVARRLYEVAQSSGLKLPF